MTGRSSRDPRRCPAHPGRILREYSVPALELPKTTIAEHLGISRQTLYDLLAEKQPVTPQMAVRIGKLLGNGPALWLNMQTAYDLWHAKRETDVSGIPTFKPKKVAIRPSLNR
jgi:antitoxin HigA-1